MGDLEGNIFVVNVVMGLMEIAAVTVLMFNLDRLRNVSQNMHHLDHVDFINFKHFFPLLKLVLAVKKPLNWWKSTSSNELMKPKKSTQNNSWNIYRIWNLLFDLWVT